MPASAASRMEVESVAIDASRWTDHLISLVAELSEGARPVSLLNWCLTLRRTNGTFVAFHSANLTIMRYFIGVAYGADCIRSRGQGVDHSQILLSITPKFPEFLDEIPLGWQNRPVHLALAIVLDVPDGELHAVASLPIEMEPKDLVAAVMKRSPASRSPSKL